MPEGEAGKITISTSNLHVSRIGLSGELEAKASVGAIVKTLFPFLDAGVAARVKAEGGRESHDERQDSVELYPITTPQRQLVQLALHYLSNLPDRFLYIQGTANTSDLNEAFISAAPRSLLFLDLPPKAPIIPLAAELSDGKVVTLYDRLEQELATVVRTLPVAHPGGAEPYSPGASQEHWAWYVKNFDSMLATQLVEDSIGTGGRPRWLDYRTPLEGEGYLHLHISGRQAYDTGMYAYNLIRRGWKYGVRLVGTLRAGPSLNVLAIFDK
jgi:hypothetical protein